MYPTKEN